LRAQPDAGACQHGARDTRLRSARGASLLRRRRPPRPRHDSPPGTVRAHDVRRSRCHRDRGARARPATRRAHRRGAGRAGRGTPGARATARRRCGVNDFLAGTTILEFGGGAAGPIATRYFADHGATVVRVESRQRPDFLRILKLTPDTPGGIDGSEHFAVLNANKLSVSLNLSTPEGVAVARRLALRVDAVAENFAPGAMAKWGLDYESLVKDRADLVMISTCLNGQTGPQRFYPGFGGQGSALSGFNHLTGWPDREPVGPYGTITDSLSPPLPALLLATPPPPRARPGHAPATALSPGAGR